MKLAIITGASAGISWPVFKAGASTSRVVAQIIQTSLIYPPTWLRNPKLVMLLTSWRNIYRLLPRYVWYITPVASATTQLFIVILIT